VTIAKRLPMTAINTVNRIWHPPVYGIDPGSVPLPH